MGDWTPVPEPITWTLPRPLEHGGLTYTTITIGAPTGEDILKATAVRGATGLDVLCRVIEAASAEHVPYDVLKKQPEWLLTQISGYIDEFAGTPAPDPLEAWRTARQVAAVAPEPDGTEATPPASC